MLDRQNPNFIGILLVAAFLLLNMGLVQAQPLEKRVLLLKGESPAAIPVVRDSPNSSMP